ncbi:PAS domain S-box-containing protein [Mucilaginibacter frigoritolerans]|uniref:histidine kinase n=1 Tax=Mucilaginibacter frigoritolerans TaxID=652788 RepID=A0A562TPV6_9SPHI|nr:PAS domain S-box protein [Mucilaginibacter frigoritolerans]TWI95542.1 PAS domain S-box-containing protein [Mucilaginibacter frigoritolerans]
MLAFFDAELTNMSIKPNRNNKTLPRQKVQDKRQIDEKLCRAMVNSIVDYAVILTDPQGLIISLNKGAELILQYNEREVTGKPVTIFYPDETLSTDGPDMNLQEALINNNYQVKGWRVKKDGTKFMANIHYTALYDENHHLLGYTKIIYEIKENGIAGNDNKIKHNHAENNISFRKLIENSYSGIFLLDKDFKVIYRSLSAQRISGWSTTDVIKAGMSELIHPDDRERVRLLLNEVLKSPGVPKACVYQSKHFNGDYMWLDCVFTNFLNEPNVNAIVCNFIDVTEKRVIEQKAIEGEKFIKTITDNLPALIAYWTADRHCLFANKPYSDWFEKQPEEMINISKKELLGEEEYKKDEIYISGVLSGIPQSYERTFYNPGGRRIFTHTQYIPDKVEGEVKGFYSLIYDITEVKLAEQEINKKTAQIENLLENILDGFIALDGNLRYTYTNKQIGKLLGIPHESLIGRYIWDVFPDLVGSEFYRIIERANAEKINLSNEDFYAPLNSWQENRVYPTDNGISIFVRDITQRKIEEQQTELLAEISAIFNEPWQLNDILYKVLKRLADYGDFSMAEVWLTSSDMKKAHLAVKYAGTQAISTFYKESNELKNLVKGEGLPGVVWETGKVQFIPDLIENEIFTRKKAAQKAGLKSAYGIPLRFKNEIIGIIILGLNREEKQQGVFTALFEKFNKNFGIEIQRKKLEDELNQLFNSAPDVICTAGVDGYWKKVNPAMMKLLDYTELELLNRPLMEFIHPDDRPGSIAQFREITDGEAVTYFENRYITRTGKIKRFAWTTSAASPDGLVYCVAKDITDKRELEDLLKKATTLARIGGWDIDLVKGTVHWSDITREIHEVDADFKPDLESGVSFYKGESKNYITQKVKDAMEKGTSWDVELQIITARGNEKWIRVIGEAEMRGTKCIRVYGSFQDIDARKKAEIFVTEILEERNIILESIGDAFFAVDKNWIVTYWNNMAEKVLGKSKQEMLNHNLWDVFVDSIDSESYRNYHLAIENNSAMHFEDYYQPLDKWYEISAYPSASGLSVYFKDTTERKVSESKLKELNESLQIHTKELATSNAELEQFAYVASHDLQEPLRMITGFLTQIERKYGDTLDEKGRQYINFAVDGAKRMRQIILDLLEFSKVGVLEDSLEEINVEELISDIMALYRKQIEEKKAKVLFNNLPVISAYKTPLRQILTNLISNGLKYSKTGIPPQIKIECKEKQSHWQFSVSDNGIGIESVYFDKIFIIFQRLHNRDEYAGTGMGLALVKKIVESRGGKIWIESAENIGSTFYFTILKNKRL